MAPRILVRIVNACPCASAFFKNSLNLSPGLIASITPSLQWLGGPGCLLQKKLIFGYTDFAHDSPIEPERCRNIDSKVNEKFPTNIKRIELVQPSIKAAIVGAWCSQI
jgi:hypothetical protein